MDRDTIQHEPVLSNELLDLLGPGAGETVLDATLGHGGHAGLLAAALGPCGRLIGLDVDQANLERAGRRLEELHLPAGRPWIHLERANFVEARTVLERVGVPAVDILLADLGVSTDQLLDSNLGLSFSEGGPLDMRLDDRLPRSAADLVNALGETELADLIFFNSQERFSRRIAKRICEARRNARIRTTTELVRIVCSAVGASPDSRREQIHPATRTFLALRMAVNRETENLEALLKSAPGLLRPGGRIAVISFHSGEDRLVKQNFLDRQRANVYEIVTKKPIRPTTLEVERNPRSRSAKLRVARRVADGAGSPEQGRNRRD